MFGSQTDIPGLVPTTLPPVSSVVDMTVGGGSFADGVDRVA
jgi:hypothetical protein